MGFLVEGLRFRFPNLGGIFVGGPRNKDHDASGSALSPLLRKTNTPYRPQSDMLLSFHQQPTVEDSFHKHTRTQNYVDEGGRTVKVCSQVERAPSNSNSNNNIKKTLYYLLYISFGGVP